jgi:hypothetical protein
MRDTPAKLLVVLGAGASHGYGPSTEFLTKRILAPAAGTAGALLFRRVRSVLKRNAKRKSFHGDLAFEPNFEEIVQTVDDIASLLEGGDSMLTPFVELSSALKPLKPTRKNYVRYASRARKFILQETKRFCDRALIGRESALVKGIAALASCSRLRIMSLNYDDLVGAAGIDFFTGFGTTARRQQTFRP